MSPPQLRPPAQAFTSIAQKPPTSWEGDGAMVPRSQMGVPRPQDRETCPGRLCSKELCQPGLGGRCGRASPPAFSIWTTAAPSCQMSPSPQHCVTSTPLPSPHSLKRSESLCFDLVLKLSVKRPLLYLPSHQTLMSDLDSPPQLVSDQP